MTESNLSLTFREIIIAALTAFLTTAGAYYQFAGTKATADAANLQIIYERISNLEAQVANQQAIIKDLAVNNALLQSENDMLTVRLRVVESAKGTGAVPRVEAVYSLLESLDTPAWCKTHYEQEDGSHLFVMSYVNSWLEFEYNISRERFVGKTDFDLFDYALAEEYVQGDVKTFENKSWETFIAPRPPFGDGAGVPHAFWKFYHNIKNGPELVCGWEVD